MSGVKICRYLLANAAGVTALVPSARILAGVFPQETVMPAITLTLVSSIPTLQVGSRSGLNTDRVQVTAFAATYPEIEALLNAVKVALPYSHATINSVDCDSILPDLVGPDGFDDVLSVCFKSRDYIVKWNE